jgi:hypothetical protein
MKNLFFGIVAFASVALITLQSCDKVKNPYLPEFVDIDTTLLDGQTLADYKSNNWPTFTTNTNTLVNVLIEDFTGHRCVNCPTATSVAEGIEAAHEGRVFIAAIHADNSGSVGSFQGFDFAPYNTNFTNPNGIELAYDLGVIDVNFNANPAGTTNRKAFGGGMFTPYLDWATNTTNILNNNVLKVNIQSKTNYYPTTRGVILHTEVDLLDTSVSDVFQIVYLIEDSLISPQKLNGGLEDLAYVHRDIMRGCIDNKPWGRKLVESMKVNKNGISVPGNKYYLNYSYKLPEQFNPDIMHLLIYVYDDSTKEILQVIKQKVKN